MFLLCAGLAAQAHYGVVSQATGNGGVDRGNVAGGD